MIVLGEIPRTSAILAVFSPAASLAENLRKLLLENRFDEILECIEAYINSTDNEREKSKFFELYSYYSENKEALAGYYDRGITIPPTLEPDIVHHARLGSMEGNVFTIIGNRMKGRRACWSINGGNHLAALLCRHYSVSAASKANAVTACDIVNAPLSATKVLKKDGKGYEFTKSFSIPSGMKWLKQISACKSLTDLLF